MESEDEINEYGEIVRDDHLIMTRQNMCCDQGILEIILILLNQLLPLYIGENAAGIDDDDDDSSDDNSVIEEGDKEDEEDNEEEDEKELEGGGDTAGEGVQLTGMDTLLPQPPLDEAPTPDEVEVRRSSLLFMGTEVAKCLLRLLFQLVKRNKASQLQVANHLHVILGWVVFQPVAAAVVKEMLSDNFELQIKHIGEPEIEVFTVQIGEPETVMKSMYLSMLQAFCSCSNQGISKNQKIVLDLLSPILEDIFFTLRMQSEESGESGANIFNSALYFPPAQDRQSLGRILGGEMLTHGIPKLFLSWESPVEMYSVTALFGKNEISISDLCRAKVKERNKNLRSLTIRNTSFVEDQKRKMQASRQNMNRSASFVASRKYSFAGKCG